MSDQKSRPGVQIMTDGPYLISGGAPLSRQTIEADAEGGSEAWKESDALPLQEKYALCRCGKSSSKPFSNGTHIKIGFDVRETAARELHLQMAGTINGPELPLTDAEQLCAFDRFCDPNGQVWSQVAGTVDPDVRTTFIRQVGNRPAGRLVAWDKTTGAALEPDLSVLIGSLRIRWNNAVARFGFGEELRSGHPTDSTMKSAIA